MQALCPTHDQAVITRVTAAAMRHAYASLSKSKRKRAKALRLLLARIASTLLAAMRRKAYGMHTGCTPRDERARSVTMYCLRLNVDLFEAEMERDLCMFYDCAGKHGEMLQKMAVAARYLDQDPVSSPLRGGLTRN